MADGKLLEGWEGYSVERVEWPQEPRRTLAVHLKAMGREMHCEQYGAPCHQVQETTTRRVRDLPLFEPRWPGQIPPP
jgi:transposase